MDIAKIINLAPGRYVVAVSGGVDSISLLHLLARRYGAKGSPVRLTVAHFDHGIRDISHLDRLLVQETAHQHGLPFVYEEGRLGPSASEDVARRARYEFLRKVQSTTGARGIVTAHHLDDAVETAVLNMIRGTGRKGISSLHRDKDGLHRPLLHVPKEHLRAYAQANGLVWHEDATNSDEKYRRNYVRHSVLARLKAKSPREYNRLVALIRRQRELNEAIDARLEVLLHMQPNRFSLRRRDVIRLPYRVACELVAQWLRQNGKRQLSRWLVDRLAVAIRTARPDTELLIDSTCKVSFGKITAEFKEV